MHASVQNEGLTCGVAEGAVAECDYSLSNIVGLSPTAKGNKPPGDEIIILFLHGSGHTRGDDAGADLIDGDALRGQAVGKELGDHGDPRLGDAVFPAGGGAGVGRAGGDVDNGAALSLPDHTVGHQLGQKQRTLGIDAHNVVVAFLGHLQNVAADLGGDITEANSKAENSSPIPTSEDLSAITPHTVEVVAFPMERITARK